MGEIKRNAWIEANKQKFSQNQIGIITKKVQEMSADTFNMLNTLDFKNPTVLLIVSIFVGYLGIDRFMLGQIGAGIGKLLTFGGAGIWWIVDILTISNKTKQQNYNKIMPYL